MPGPSPAGPIASMTAGEHGEPIRHYARVVSVANHGEARAIALAGNDISIVVRGKPRWVVFRCPCGCGDILSINVDKRAGAAWQLQQQDSAVSLMPSVWRSTGCHSHFILWRNDVWLSSGALPADESVAFPKDMHQALIAEWRRIARRRRTP